MLVLFMGKEMIWGTQSRRRRADRRQDHFERRLNLLAFTDFPGECIQRVHPLVDEFLPAKFHLHEAMSPVSQKHDGIASVMSLAVFSLWQLRHFHYGSWAVSAMALEDFQGVRNHPSPSVLRFVLLIGIGHWQHFYIGNIPTAPPP